MYLCNLVVLFAKSVSSVAVAGRFVAVVSIWRPFQRRETLFVGVVLPNLWCESLLCILILMQNVTKKNLVQTISDRTGLTQIDTGIVVESFLDAISACLKQGKNIEIRGFGRFKLKKKSARNARNPRNGEIVQVEAGIKPVFQASRELAKRINAASEAAKLEKSFSPHQSNNGQTGV